MDPNAPPRSRRVVANTLDHHVLEWDGGGRTTVLCLHGFLDLAWGWSTVAPALARAGYHVVAPDFRGHGDSARVGAGGYYHFFDYLFDVADLADALRRDRLYVAGHSMGGAVASYFAGSFPEALSKLALLEGLGGSDEPMDTMPRRGHDWVKTVRKARARKPRVYPSLAAAAARLREVDARCPEELALLLAEKGTTPVEGGLAFKHDPVHLTRGPLPFRLEILRTFWRTITCPTLLVDGAESDFHRLFPDLPERARTFASARSVSIDGAGHMMLRHQPAAVARALLAFFAEPDRAP